MGPPVLLRLRNARSRQDIASASTGQFPIRSWHGGDKRVRAYYGCLMAHLLSPTDREYYYTHPSLGGSRWHIPLTYKKSDLGELS